MNVLVYSAEQVLPTSLDGILRALRTRLDSRYAVQSISHHALISHPWFNNCAALIFPRFMDPILPGAASAITKFISSGGSFIAVGCKLNMDVNGAARSSHGTIPLHDSASQVDVQLEIIGADSPAPMKSIEFGKNRHLSLPCPSYICSFDHASLRDASVLGRDFSNGGIFGLAFSVGEGKVVAWSSYIDAESVSSQLTEHWDHFWEQTLGHARIKLPPKDAMNRYMRPLPQFFITSGGFPRHASKMLSLSSGSIPGVLDDAGDTFIIRPLDEAAVLLTATMKQEQDTSAEDKFKYIIVCEDGKLPPTALTPLFDLGAFFGTLRDVRRSIGGNHDCWSIGDIVLYGEAVTSTQTMLDQNISFLNAVPTPLISIASHQLRGRGRGGNSWVSPAGCLQFTTLVRVSLSILPANKLVFIQYLFALAVVEACRDSKVLGDRAENIRLKWPNDIYIVIGEDKRKIGGILVNTSFTASEVSILIGCGLNVRDALHMSSLSQLSDGQHLSIESTAAVIVATFESMWQRFIAENGSFDSFLDLYLSRWLHSDELVTLTTSTPQIPVRIIGITKDYGLLRTVPVRTNSAHDEEFIDLQPDGNSFDIMSGLIKTKD